MSDETKAELGDFEGRDVVRTSLAVTGAGDGLSEAMNTEPQVFHLGDRVRVVLDCYVAKVNHVPVKVRGGGEPLDVLERVHVLRAETALVLESDVLDEAIETQRQLVERAREQRAGKGRQPFAEEQTREHRLGLHSEGTVDGCPECDGERDAEAAEASEDELAARRAAE